ncbi:TFIIE alpha subunit [Teladorsagia circumcincta]|uniref:TFIIE alpha subunit n=1 Tax=Teladorsagia circumcincta TaxID=45464 RepID=A0A2G9TV10_TELCI|nr:TFIIE alpha subunit [Teladorsagia circumcincta]
MRAVCIREENLRSRLNFDQKQLRQLLAGLKNEKLVKDRLLQQKNETGRNVSIIFYFINYRAIINVLKYKIDHMSKPVEEAKVVPTWLQDDAIGGGEQNVADEELGMGDDGTEAMPHVSSSVSLSLMAELENIEEPPQKRPRPNEDENGATNDETEAEEDEGDDEEEEMVLVAGRTVPLSEVTSEMVAEMTEEERDRYTAIMQENLYY